MKYALHCGLMMSAAIALAHAAPAYAQSQQTPVATNEAPSVSEGLEEITVTAQRRAQRLQDVPIAITALTSQTLDDAGINNTLQLATVTPGLQINLASNIQQLFLRGVGSEGATARINVDSSIATYVDGVYVAYPGAALQELFDVERVEVLRGPQGTLYGRNATGGAVNIITRRPSPESEFLLAVTAGNYDLRQVQAFATGALAPTLFASLAASYRDRDSYNRNVSPTPVPQGEEAQSLRGKILWEPNEDWSVELSADYSRNESTLDGQAWRQIQPNGTGLVMGGQTGTRPLEVALSAPDFGIVEQVGGYARIEADFDAVNFVSLTGYRDSNWDQSTELSGTTLNLLRSSLITSSRQISQEFQLSSPSSSTIQWVGGLYFFRGDEAQDPSTTLIPGTLNREIFLDIETTAYAAFAQATVPVTDRLSLTGGVRQTYEEKELSNISTVLFFPVNSTTGMAPPPAAEFENFSYRVALDFQATDDLLFYVSHGTGFKSGSYNTGNLADLGPVQPEQLTAYEAGVKSDWFDNRLRVNASLFRYDVEDLQVLITGVGTTNSFLRNAASARMQGGELEVAVAPLSGLDISAGISILDSEYKSFQNFPAFQVAAVGNVVVPTDVSGQPVTRAPEFTAFAQASYEFDVTGLGNVRFGGTFYHNSGYKLDASGRTGQSAFNTVSTFVTLAPEGQNWDIELWGRNIFDERYYSYRVLTAQGDLALYAPPVTYGVTLSLKF